MKIFLSSLEVFPGIRPDNMKWNLISYYAVRGNQSHAEDIRDRSEEVIVDSGAFTFIEGTATAGWDSYCDEYCRFIERYDRANVIGYIELDIDVVAGYEKALELRGRLRNVTDKIIPVWHKNRGIPEYRKMCEEYSGKIVAITGVRNRDIPNDMYKAFLREAWDYGCYLHCLGMTRETMLKEIPFDYTDSTSWLSPFRWGRLPGGGRLAKTTGKSRAIVGTQFYKAWMQKQEYYYRYWRGAREKYLASKAVCENLL